MLCEIFAVNKDYLGTCGELEKRSKRGLGAKGIDHRTFTTDDDIVLCVQFYGP